MNYKKISLEEMLTRTVLKKSHIITITGAGGKTTLMEQLAQQSQARGETVLLTTTTHIMRPASSKLTAFRRITEEDLPLINSCFQSRTSVCLGIPCSISAGREKWQAPSLSFLEEISSLPQRIICEGDGARRLPLKAEKNHEPVFYPGTDTVLGVIGLSCLGQTAGQVMYGYEIWGLSPENSITCDLLNRLILSPWGPGKNAARKNFHLFFNQADLLLTDPLKMDSILALCSRLESKNINCHIVSLKEDYAILPLPGL